MKRFLGGQKCRGAKRKNEKSCFRHGFCKISVFEEDYFEKFIKNIYFLSFSLLNATNKGEKVDHLQEENDACWNKVESCKVIKNYRFSVKSLV